MADEPENLTLRILQELREEIQSLREEQADMRKDLTNRINGNTVMLGMLAGMVHDHEERIEKLENR
jgi:uncharacterized protein with ATP-grasp and redox domains